MIKQKLEKIKKIELDDIDTKKLEMFMALKFAICRLNSKNIDEFYGKFFGENTPNLIKAFLRYPRFESSELNGYCVQQLNKLNGSFETRFDVILTRTRKSIIASCKIMQIPLTISEKKRRKNKILESIKLAKIEEQKRIEVRKKQMLVDMIKELKNKNYTEEEILKYVDQNNIIELIKGNDNND